MKKMLFLLAIVFTLALASCVNKKTPAPATATDTTIVNTVTDTTAAKTVTDTVTVK